MSLVCVGLAASSTALTGVTSARSRAQGLPRAPSAHRPSQEHRPGRSASRVRRQADPRRVRLGDRRRGEEEALAARLVARFQRTRRCGREPTRGARRDAAGDAPRPHRHAAPDQVVPADIGLVERPRCLDTSPRVARFLACDGLVRSRLLQVEAPAVAVAVGQPDPDRRIRVPRALLESADVVVHVGHHPLTFDGFESLRRRSRKRQSGMGVPPRSLDR